MRNISSSWLFLSLVPPAILLTSCGGENSEQAIDMPPTPEQNVEHVVPEAPEGMVHIPGGSFLMGGDAGEMGGNSSSHQTAYPIRDVYVDSFWMDETEVTNQQFAEFVEATGYVTFAERPMPEEVVANYQQMAETNLARMRNDLSYLNGEEKAATLAAIKRLEESMQTIHLSGAILFSPPEGQVYEGSGLTQWWKIVPGATWRSPGGPETTWKDIPEHPVVNVTHEDATAYAKWAGKRLPTEAEWEKAARGGLSRKPFVWGDAFSPQGEDVWMANIWQGAWPYENTGEDGYVDSAPVKSFPPNQYGLYDIAGNVWEIVNDLYHPAAYELREDGAINPRGPRLEQVARPGQRVLVHITRGGSFLCSDGWCKGYQPGSRQPIDGESPASHTGFRCVKDIPKSSS